MTAASAATDSFVFYTAMKIADGFFSAGLGLVRPFLLLLLLLR